MKKREPEPEGGAPAYMAQFTALMTILLAFFIMMLTIGQQRVAKYKMEGFGFVRDAFGTAGGQGILRYMKAFMRWYPRVGAAAQDDTGKDDDRTLLGYEKGAFEAEQLESEGILMTDIEEWGHHIRIRTPIAFKSDDWTLDASTRQFMDAVGSVFYNLTNHVVTVHCYELQGDDPQARQLLAARRAGAIAVYLERQCRIPVARIRFVGYSSARYLELVDDPATHGVVLFVRKI